MNMENGDKNIKVGEKFTSSDGLQSAQVIIVDYSDDKKEISIKDIMEPEEYEKLVKEIAEAEKNWIKEFEFALLWGYELTEDVKKFRENEASK